MDQDPFEKLYADAKRTAADRLGGERAYWIVGPNIRRMAVADSTLTILATLPDATLDSTVRMMLEELFYRLRNDPDFQS